MDSGFSSLEDLMAKNPEQGETWRGLQGLCLLFIKYLNLTGKRMNLTLQELSSAFGTVFPEVFWLPNKSVHTAAKQWSET